MALTFYATNEDLTDLSSRLFEVPGMMLFEEYSAPDQQNRYFEIPDDIAKFLNDGAHSFAAWPSGVGGRLTRTDIVFNTDHQERTGKRGRAVLESPAIIRFNRMTTIAGCLNPSSILCWSEKGARQRSGYHEEALTSVDWSKLKSIVASIERWIKKRSPARLRSHPVMPSAFRQMNNGEVLLWNFGEKVGLSSLDIK